MSTILLSLLLTAAMAPGCGEHLGAVPADEGGRRVTVTDVNGLSSLKNVQPGDTVIIADGEYKDVSIVLSAKGTASAPVTFKAETSGKVCLTGTSSLRIKGSYVVVEGLLCNKITPQSKDVISFDKSSSHCVLKSCKIDGSGREYGTPDSAADKWVSLKGVENQVVGCTFTDKRNMGTLLVVWMEDGIVPRHVIANNFFSRPYTIYDSAGKAVNGQETIRIGDSRTSMSDACCIVRDNFFFQCHGERAEIISNKTCGNLYEHNCFYDSDGTLTLRHGNNCTVRGNFFRAGSAKRSGGVRIIGEGHLVENNVIESSTGSGYNSAICIVQGESDAELNGYWTVRDAVVRNNVITGCKSGILVNYGVRDSQDTVPENILVEGNIIVPKSSKDISVQECGNLSDDEVQYRNNVVFGGKQKDVHVSLPQASEEPRLEDISAEFDAIMESAGVKW